MVSSTPTVIIPKFRPKEDKNWWSVLERNMRLGIGRERVLTANRMKDTARLEAMTPRKTVDGLGQLTAIIDLQNYLRWDQEFKGCWGDKSFGREYLRDNPEARASRPQKKYH